MASTIGEPYLTVAEYKLRSTEPTAKNDAVLATVIAGACSAIDEICGQQFNHTDTGAVRYLDVSPYWCSRDVLEIPDGLIDLTGIATDDGSRTYPGIWTVADWELAPTSPRPGRPFTEIHRTPAGSFAFIHGRRMVKLTGQFGWAAVPDAIKSAAYLIARRHFERWTAPFGVAGGGELGSNIIAIPGMDKDVMQILKPFYVGGVV